MHKLLLTLMLITGMYGLELYQFNNLKIGYDVGKSVKADDNTTFEQAVSTIMLTESSAGRDAIGDIKKEKYYYKHKGSKVYLTTNEDIGKLYTENGNLYYPFKPYKREYKKRVYTVIDGTTELSDASLGVCQVRVPTAQRTIRETPELIRYTYLLYNEKALINKLLTDVRFNASISAYYLRMNYNQALKDGYKNPYYVGISQQNGGKNNKPYYKRFKKNREIIRSNISIISDPVPIVITHK